MNTGQIGKLIREIRLEKHMTQRQLAESLNITEQAVSKWERGIGSPDIALLSQLADILGINIEKILAGNLQANDSDSGNIQKIKFYVCPECGGILTSTGAAEVSCCGRKLAKLQATTADESHWLSVTQDEGEYYITSTHEMVRAHYISFIACVSADKLLLVKLYPEQGVEVRIPRLHGSTLYYYCTQHGLIKEKIK